MILNESYLPGLPYIPVKKPTLKHRPAIWENILATVYAMNDNYETKYFDYKYNEAIEWCGFSEDKDPRLYKNIRRVRWNPDTYKNPRFGRLVLWILKE